MLLWMTHTPYLSIHLKCTFTTILPWVWRCRSGGSIFLIVSCWLRKLGISVVGPMSMSSSAECSLMLINEWNRNKVRCTIFHGLHQILLWRVIYLCEVKLFTCFSKSSHHKKFSSQVSPCLIWFPWTTLPQTLTNKNYQQWFKPCISTFQHTTQYLLALQTPSSVYVIAKHLDYKIPQSKVTSWNIHIVQ